MKSVSRPGCVGVTAKPSGGVMVCGDSIGSSLRSGSDSPLASASGYARGMNANPFNGWQTSLPLYIYYEIQSPANTDKIRAFGGGFALVILVLVLFAIARRAGGGTPGELTRRQRRRLEKESARQRAAREGMGA